MSTKFLKAEFNKQLGEKTQTMLQGAEINWNPRVLTGNLQESRSIVTVFTELLQIHHKLFNSITLAFLSHILLTNLPQKCLSEWKHDP